MISDTEHLFMYLSNIWLSSLILCPFKKSHWLLGFKTELHEFYIFWILTPFPTHGLQFFHFHFGKLIFLFIDISLVLQKLLHLNYFHLFTSAFACTFGVKSRI